jgi:hypothetical protein
MSMLGEATDKIVVLTMENSPAAVILRYSPGTRAVEWPSLSISNVRHARSEPSPSD